MPPLTKTYGSLNPLLAPKPKTPAVSGVPVTQPVRPTPAPAPRPVVQNAPVAPVVAPVAPTPAPTTPAAVYGADLNTYNPTDAYDKALNDRIQNTGSDANIVVDEKQIYRDKLKMYQKEIDAVNQLYKEKLRVENVAGQGRLGSGRAIQGRSGLLGSDFASAQNDQIGQMNTDIRSGIQGEQALAIQTILGNARKDAQEEATAKRAAKEQGAESYLKFLGEQSTRRASKLEGFLASLGDTDLSKVSPTNLAEVARSYGITVDELKTQAKAVKDGLAQAAKEADQKDRKTEAEIEKINADIAKGKLIEISEGTMLYNTETGETFKNPKTYAPSGGGTGGDMDKLLSISEAQTLGVPYGTTVGQAVMLGKTPQGKVTGSQSNDLGFYNRGKDALDNIATIEPNITKQSFGKAVGGQVLPNFLQSSDQQVYRQAQRQFTEARLRKESGAAIPNAEYETDAATYFFQPGDSPAVQEQKKRAREAVLDSLAVSAGPAYTDYYGEQYTPGAKSTPTTSVVPTTQVPAGYYQASDGLFYKK